MSKPSTTRITALVASLINRGRRDDGAVVWSSGAAMHSAKSLRILLPLLLLATSVFSGSCGGGSSGDGRPDDGICAQPSGDPPELGVVPDFRLRDMNLNSATALTCVSPRDYLTRVSAWYWGHTT